MTTVQLKKAVHDYIDNLDDNFLQIVHSMLETHAQQVDPIIGYDADGTPLRASEMKKLYEQDMKDMENGDFVTLEELRKESVEWMNAMK